MAFSVFETFYERATELFCVYVHKDGRIVGNVNKGQALVRLTSVPPGFKKSDTMLSDDVDIYVPG